MAILKQRSLARNTLIDLVAPASPVTSAQIMESVRQVENMGFQARILTRPIKNFLFSANDKERFLYLKKALTHSDSEVVWCIRGGYGCQRLMPFLLKMTKPSKMKMLIGYSDVTVLQNFLNLKWGWPSLHFPVLADLQYASSATYKRFQNLVSGVLKKQTFRNLRLLNPSSVKIKKIKTVLTGGNLTVVQSSIGTPWQFSFQNKILFLEDVGESAYRLDRALWQMQKAGVFKGVKALVLGTFTSAKNISSPAKKMEEKQMKKVFELFAHHVSFPVLWGLPCGHGMKKESLSFMTPCELQLYSTGKAQLQVQSPFV